MRKDNIFFTSDTHYGHSNVSCKEASSWTEGFRNFKSLEHMNQTIVQNINKTVPEDGILYHLGDWSFGGIKNILNFRKQIVCKRIHLIFGNHDDHIINGKMVFDKDWDEYEIPAHLAFDSVAHVKLLYVEKQPIFLSHYSHRVWNGSHKGYWHLYGHSHGSLERFPYGKSMDVGVDAANRIFGEFRPFSYREIEKIMADRPILFPDHHDEKTNV